LKQLQWAVVRPSNEQDTGKKYPLIHLELVLDELERKFRIVADIFRHENAKREQRQYELIPPYSLVVAWRTAIKLHQRMLDEGFIGGSNCL
jgi:hypothetical protein